MDYFKEEEITIPLKIKQLTISGHYLINHHLTPDYVSKVISPYMEIGVTNINGELSGVNPTINELGSN